MFWRRVFGQLSRYDLLLAVIPLAFIVAILATIVAGIQLELAVAGGAVVSLFALADGIYFNPPGTTDHDSHPAESVSD